jgi:S1-C subfamily serine protease
VAEETVSSGFYVNAEGWALTNRHVVEGCATVTVAGVPAVSVILDEGADLAAVHAPAAGIVPLRLRIWEPVAAEEVVVLGYPLAQILSGDVVITAGIVNAAAGPGGDTRFIQISAPIQPGSSGGPVLDAEGQVIGVTAAALSEAVFASAQAVNFAVTAAEALRFLDAADIAHEEGRAVPGAVVMLGSPEHTPLGRAARAAVSVVPVVCTR